jgi:hypothetical protein
MHAITNKSLKIIDFPSAAKRNAGHCVKNADDRMGTLTAPGSISSSRRSRNGPLLPAPHPARLARRTRATHPQGHRGDECPAGALPVKELRLPDDMIVNVLAKRCTGHRRRTGGPGRPLAGGTGAARPREPGHACRPARPAGRRPVRRHLRLRARIVQRPRVGDAVEPERAGRLLHGQPERAGLQLLSRARPARLLVRGPRDERHAAEPDGVRRRARRERRSRRSPLVPGHDHRLGAGPSTCALVLLAGFAGFGFTARRRTVAA